MKWFREHTKLAMVIAVFLILVIIIVASFINRGNSSPMGRAVSGVFAYVQEPLSNIGKGISDGFSGIFRFREIVKENEALKAQIEELNNEVIKLQLTDLEHQELRELSRVLDYGENLTENYPKVTADVISLDPSNWFNLFTINAGTNHGITRDCVVLNGDGLIGRVYEVGDNWAKVISIIDESTYVSFRVVQKMELLGMLNGDGNGGLEGYMLDPDAAVTEGDVLITTGTSMYPAGIPIGKITEVIIDKDSLLKTVLIEPSVNFKNINKVTVFITNS